MPNQSPPPILVINDKKSEKTLRRKTSAFDFSKFTKKDIAELIARMRQVMRAANGIGLSANQIGVDLNMFVAEIPDPQGGTKFYSVFNPSIEKLGDEKGFFEEGCLSVPGKYGDVERALRITIAGFDKNNRPLRIKAWGLLARVFQHEIDHLNGKLFIDRTKRVYTNE